MKCVRDRVAQVVGGRGSPAERILEKNLGTGLWEWGGGRSRGGGREQNLVAGWRQEWKPGQIAAI